MPGTHSNALAYRKIIDAADNGTRPVIEIHLGTSRSSSYRGGRIMHHVARGGTMRGEWAWPCAGQLNQHGADSTTSSLCLEGFSDYTLPAAVRQTWQLLPQATNWNFFAVPCTGNTCVAYRDSGSGGNAAGFNLYYKAIRRHTSEFTLVDRTFTTGSGAFKLDAVSSLLESEPQVNSPTYPTNTGKVETRLTRLDQMYPEDGSASSLFVNGTTGPTFICGGSLRDVAKPAGVYIAGLAHAGGRNQRHVLDTIKYVTGLPSITEFIRTLIRCNEHPNPRVLFSLEYGHNQSPDPTAIGPAVEDPSVCRHLTYRSDNGTFPNCPVDITGWSVTFLDWNYAVAQNADFQTRTVTSFNTTSKVATLSAALSVYGSDSNGRCLARATPPAGINQPANYRIAMRELVGLVLGCAQDAGATDPHAVVMSMTAGLIENNADVANARRDDLITEFATASNVSVLDEGPAVISAAALSAIAIAATGTFDFIHPPPAAFRAVFDAQWADVVAQTTATPIVTGLTSDQSSKLNNIATEIAKVPRAGTTFRHTRGATASADVSITAL